MPTASVPPTKTLPPQERDTRAAEEAVTAYWVEISTLAGDPKVRLEDLTPVARGTAAAQWRQIIARYRVRGWRQIGTPTVRVSASSKSGEGRFKVKACLDVEEVNLVDGRGKSRSSPIALIGSSMRTL